MILLKDFAICIYLFLITVFCSCNTLPNQKKQDSPIARIEKSLYPIYNIKGLEQAKSILEMMHACQIAGLSMAFVDSGKIAWTACYGYANRKDSVKVNPNTVFRAASLSKPLTAMAALHLVERGLLDLDKDINLKLNGWKLPDNDFTKNQKVTVEHLIAHRSGIKNDQHAGIAAEDSMPSLEEIFSGKTKYPPLQIISMPGEKQKYSNMGYMLLSELMQDATGKPFPDLLEALVFKPCGMKQSTFKQDLSASFKSNCAIAYNETGEEIPFYKHASAGAGALWSTPSDLCLFLAEILNTYADKTNSGKIISHAIAKHVFANSNEKLGFNKYREDGYFLFRNDGSIDGYTCFMMGSLDKKQAVVVMLNTGSEKAYDFLNHLWRAVSREYHWGLFEPSFYETIRLPENDLKKFIGSYSNLDDSFYFQIKENQLVINSSSFKNKTLVPISKTSFLLPEIPMKFSFELDSTKNPVFLYLRNERGDPFPPLTKIKK